MKKVYFLLFVLLCFYGCKEESILMSNGITSSFELYDNDEVKKTIFKSGEDFKMIFMVTNLSGKDLYYGYTGVPVVFEIHQNDSTVATSTDGLVFAQVALKGTIKNGETFKADWLAPSSKGRIPKISLPAGNYKAYVKYGGFFIQSKIDKTPPIEFVVTD